MPTQMPPIDHAVLTALLDCKRNRFQRQVLTPASGFISSLGGLFPSVLVVSARLLPLRRTQ